MTLLWDVELRAGPVQLPIRLKMPILLRFLQQGVRLKQALLPLWQPLRKIQEVNAPQRLPSPQLGVQGQLTSRLRKQAGTPPVPDAPTLMLTSGNKVDVPNTATLLDSVEIMFVVGGGATGWKATVDSAFVTLGKTMGSSGTDTLKAAVKENTGVERTATITLTATPEGTEKVDTTITITQEAGTPPVPDAPTLMLTSGNKVDVPNTATLLDSVEIMFVVGGGATGWKATVDSAFVTLGKTMGSSGTDTLKAAVKENTGVERRTATITLTATPEGTEKVDTTITITQEAGTPPVPDAPTLMLTSGNKVDVPNTATLLDSVEIMFVVGGGATGWKATVDSAFVTLGKTMGSSGTDTLKAAVKENTGVERRTATITLTATPEGTEKVDTTITITQEAGTPPVPDAPTLMLTSGNKVDVPNTATLLDSVEIMFVVGGGATGWKATVDSAFVTLGKTMGSSGTDTLKAAVKENTGVERTATITLTATPEGTEKVDTTITITQEAGTPPVPDAPTLMLTSGNKVDVPNTATLLDSVEIMFVVGGGATGWKATVDSAFVTLGKTMGSSGTDTLKAAVKENTGVERRTATITLTATPEGTEKVDTTITITQEAGTPPVPDAPTLMLTSGNKVDVPNTATLLDSVEIMFVVGGGATGWKATVDSAFVTLGKTMGSSGTDTLKAAVKANTGVERRTATITLTATPEGTEKVDTTITITQEAGTPPVPDAPTLMLTSGNKVDVPNTATLSDSVEIMFVVGGGATGWKATVDSAFVTLGKTMGSSGTDTLKAAVKENTGVERRTATITLTATPEGTEKVDTTITITQEAGTPPVPDAPTLMLTSGNKVDVPNTATLLDSVEIMFVVGGGATGWKATVDSAFVTLGKTMGSSGTDTLKAAVKENTGVERTATITLTATPEGTEKVDTTITITQEAGTPPVPDAPTLMLTSGNKVDVPNTATLLDSVEIMFVVGGGATGWKATVDSAFVTLGKTMGSSGTDTLKAAVKENTGVERRTATITLTATPEGTEKVDTTITITQEAGTPPVPDAPTLMLTSGNKVDVPNTATLLDSVEIMFTVGGGATGWKATVDSAFVILGKAMGSSGTDTLKAAVKENTGVERTATITLTATPEGTEKVDTTITITQEAGTPPVPDAPTLMLTSGNKVDVPNTATTSLDSIAIMFTVGGGATGWGATVDSAFVTLGKIMGSSGTDTLKAAITANAGVKRTATITLTATPEGTEKVDTTITITQEAGTPPVPDAPTLMLTSKDTVDIPNTATSLDSIAIMFTVGGGATGWKATVDSAFVILGKAMGSSGTDTLKAAVTANAGVKRTATITLTAEGTEKVDTTITITQAAGPPTLTLSSKDVVLSMGEDSDTAKVDATAQTLTVGVTLGGSAEGWDVTEISDFITTSKVGNDLLRITILENTTTDSREAILTFTTTGGTGEVTQTLVITQLASGAKLPTLTLSGTGITEPSGSETSYTADVDSAAQMLTVSVAISDGTDGWKVMKTSDDQGFVTLLDSTGAAGSNVKLMIKENLTTASREATLTFTTTGAAPQTLVITQAGGVPTLSITETSLAVDSAAGTANIKIMSNTDWRVTTTASFVDSLIFTPTEGSVVASAVPSGDSITLEGTGSGNLRIVYEANTGAAREADITLTRTGGTDIAIKLTQAAGPPTIMLTSRNTVEVLNTSDSIAIMFVVGGGSTGWTAAVDADFVTLDATMGSLGTDTLTLKAAVTENTGVERTAIITLTATTDEGTEKVDTTIMIKQGGAPPTLQVAIPTPKSGSDTTIAYDATTLNVIFTVGGGAKGWVALSIDGDTLKSGNAGTGTIDVSFDETTGEKRMDTVVITTVGGTGDAADTVIVTQEAVPTIKVTDPSDGMITIDHNVTDQTITFNVGGSATGWTASSDHDSVALSSTSGNSAGIGMVTATFKENKDVERNAKITLMTTGQLGASVIAEVTITQTGAPGAPKLDVTTPSGLTDTVANTATSDSVEIVFKIKDAPGWESMIFYGVGEDEFITLSETANVGQTGEVRIKAAVTKNEGVERSATITLSTTGQIGFSAATREITIVQRGAPPMITESGDTTIAYDVTATDTLDVITFEVGGGATGWEAKVIDGDKFLTLVDSKGGADTGTIRVTADENTGEAPRMDTIVITTEGGTGEAATDTVIVTQEEIPTIEVTSSDEITIDYDITAAQTIEFNVGGSATGWRVTSNHDSLTLSPTSGSSGTGQEVMATFTENTSVERTATITITTTGQLGAAKMATVTITQSKAPTILVEPHTLMLTSGNTVDVANTATVSTDSIEIRFVVGGEATGWMAAVNEDFVTLDTTMGSSGTDTLTLKAAVTANTGIERTAIITLTTTGSTGTAVDTTIMIKQAAGSPTLLLISDSSVAVAKTATTSADSIEIMFVVGGEATGWKATVNQTFVTLDTTMGSSGTDTLTLKAAVTANTGAARTATVTITTTGQSGDSVTADVTITQATGIVPPVSNPPTLMLTSGNAVSVANTATASADSIAIMFTVGGGATGWTAAANPTFVTLGKSTGSSGTVTLKAAVTANTGIERTATITLTTTGSTGTAVDTTITITQAAGTPLSVPTQTPLAIYPNPVGNTLTIEGASTSLQISIMDFSGRQVVYSELSTGQNTLDVADLPSGLYVIIVHGEEGEVFTGQIFKK